MKKISKILTIVLFLGMMYGLTIVNVLAPQRTFSDNENRVLEQMPQLSLKNIFSGSFDTQFEKWFADQFVGRDIWISIKAGTKLASGGIQNNDVYFGKRDHLIGRFVKASDKTLENNAAKINEFSEIIDQKVHVLIVPTATWTYADNLPADTWNLDQDEYIDKAYELLKKQDCIDIRDQMKEEGLYFRTDHHWNVFGAQKGYEAICKEVLKKEADEVNHEIVADGFKGTMYSKAGLFWRSGEPIYKVFFDDELKATMKVDGTTEMDSIYNDERLNEKDKYTYYVDGNHSLYEIHTNRENGKKAVIIKDSYAHILLPYLANEYEDIVMVDLRYYHDVTSTFVDDDTDVYVIYNIDNFTNDTYMAFLK